MIWLVDPGEYPQQEAEEEWAEAGRDEAPNADTGAFVGYPLPRMVYGVYENRDEAEQALSEISESLQRRQGALRSLPRGAAIQGPGLVAAPRRPAERL
jgi:hypothetical protein